MWAGDFQAHTRSVRQSSVSASWSAKGRSALSERCEARGTCEVRDVRGDDLGEPVAMWRCRAHATALLERGGSAVRMIPHA